MHKFLRRRDPPSGGADGGPGQGKDKPRHRFSLRRRRSAPAASPAAVSVPAASRQPQKSWSERRRNELEQAFWRFDRDGDGRISVDEMRAVLESLGQDASEASVRRLMSAGGGGGNDEEGEFMKLEDFVRANTEGVSGSAHMRDVEGAFRVYDSNGDGRISAEELHAVLNALGDPTSVGECRNIIRAVDSNRDGSIDLGEFKAMMMSKMMSSSPSPSPSLRSLSRTS